MFLQSLNLVLAMAYGKLLTGEQVALHNSHESCWIIVHGTPNCAFRHEVDDTAKCSVFV